MVSTRSNHSKSLLSPTHVPITPAPTLATRARGKQGRMVTDGFGGCRLTTHKHLIDALDRIDFL